MFLLSMKKTTLMRVLERRKFSKVLLLGCQLRIKQAINYCSSVAVFDSPYNIYGSTKINYWAKQLTFVLTTTSILGLRQVARSQLWGVHWLCQIYMLCSTECTFTSSLNTSKVAKKHGGGTDWCERIGKYALVTKRAK